jgi:Txe/YoeB family toxin of Txe-Axe toxin-antitoxin module
MISSEKVTQLQQAISNKDEKVFCQIITEVLPLLDSIDCHVDGCNYDPDLIKEELKTKFWGELNPVDQEWADYLYYTQAFEYIEQKILDMVEQQTPVDPHNLSPEQQEKLQQKQEIKNEIYKAYLQSKQQ